MSPHLTVSFIIIVPLLVIATVRVSQIIQWYNNTTHEIAVYEPDYGGDTGEQRGRLTQWLEANVRWQTPDGSKPNDHAKDCSILSGVKVIFCDILEVLYCILYKLPDSAGENMPKKKIYTDLVNVVPLQISQRRWIWSVNTPSSSPSSLGSPCCSAPFSPCASPSSDGKSTYPDSRALRRSEIRRSIMNEAIWPIRSATPM